MSPKTHPALLLMAALGVACCGTQSTTNAPLSSQRVAVLINASIHTLNPSQPRAEALAVGLDGNILAIGSSGGIRTGC